MTKTRTQLCRPLIALGLALACAYALAQSVIVQGSGPGAVRATGAGSVRGVAMLIPTYTNYSDGRFTVWNTNQDVVIDNDSGLMWTQNANISGYATNWVGASNYCENLITNGYSDWRLPNLKELSRITFEDLGSTNGLFYWAAGHDDTNGLPLNHPFVNSSNEYWSATPSDVVKAYIVRGWNGDVLALAKTLLKYIWPCRGP